MKKKISNSFKSFGFVWAIIILTLNFCPYIFITFPLYLALLIRHLILVNKVFEDNESEDFTFKAKVITLIINLLVMILFSYIAFNFSPSFKVFNISK